MVLCRPCPVPRSRPREVTGQLKPAERSRTVVWGLEAGRQAPPPGVPGQSIGTARAVSSPLSIPDTAQAVHVGHQRDHDAEKHVPRGGSGKCVQSFPAPHPQEG